MIAIDIDGVVAKSACWMEKEIEERSGIKLVYSNPRKYNFVENVDIDPKDCMRYFQDAMVKYKDDISPHDYERTKKALEKIEYMEGEVIFLSARGGEEVIEATYYWLEKHFPGLFYNLYCFGHGLNKKMWMYDNNFDAIVEDRLKTVNEVASSYTNTYLVNREWNIGRETNEYVKRVSDLYEAVEDYYSIKFKKETLNV